MDNKQGENKMNIEHIEKLELGESCEYCLEDDEFNGKEFYIMEDGSTICCDSSDCRNTHVENMNLENIEVEA
tara:strand:- start:86 stop:301 length:216 start_codon:yes stop_codon:yes gene_type:complete